MKKNKIISLFFIKLAVFIFFISASPNVTAETKREYQNRIKIMLDFAARTNEYIKKNLGDKGLVSYAQAVCDENAAQAEKMTPPSKYALLHPHFLLVLENITRSFFFAAKGNLKKYRYHQKIVRKELHLLEVLAEREKLQLYMWTRCL